MNLTEAADLLKKSGYRLIKEVYGAGYEEEAMSDVTAVENVKAREAYDMLDHTSYSNPNKASLAAFCEALKSAVPSIKYANCYKTSTERQIYHHMTDEPWGTRTEKDIALEIVLESGEPKRYSLGDSVFNLQYVLNAIIKHRNALKELARWEVKHR